MMLMLLSSCVFPHIISLLKWIFDLIMVNLTAQCLVFNDKWPKKSLNTSWTYICNKKNFIWNLISLTARAFKQSICGKWQMFHKRFSAFQKTTKESHDFHIFCNMTVFHWKRLVSVSSNCSTRILFIQRND